MSRAGKPKDAKVAASRKTAAAKSTAARRRAETAAKKAESVGATGPRLSGPKLALRNSMILARHASGASWTEIAQEAGVDTRTCQRVVKQARNLPAPTSERPLQLIEDLTREMRASIGSYEAMAFGWAERNHSASLGAKKAADEMRLKLIAVLADIGKLPRDLERFRSELELERIGEEILETLEAVADGREDASAARAWIESLLRPEGVEQIIDAEEVPPELESAD
jgi:hypothetical protein